MALALGRPVAQLQRTITAAEFVEWAAYYRISPFGEARADLRIASLAALIANVNRDPKKQRKPYTPQDFMLPFDLPQPERRRIQTLDEQIAAGRRMVLALGGSIT